MCRTVNLTKPEFALQATNGFRRRGMPGLAGGLVRLFSDTGHDRMLPFGRILAVREEGVCPMTLLPGSCHIDP